MANIAVVTDSSAGIPLELSRRFDLEIVPIGIQINQEIYREGVDLEVDKFYTELESADSISTSQPSPGDFLEVYKRVATKAREIISVHVTSLGSGTVNAATLAKGEISTPTTVIDSQTASMAQGFMALAAAQAAQQGKNKQEILQIIERVREQSAVFVAIPTLKYLAKSGRVSSAKSLIASVLSIKPILGVKGGEVLVVDKSRSYPKALGRLVTLIAAKFPTEQLQVAILHSNVTKEALDFKAQVEKGLNCSKVFLTEMGASLTVHGGQGMLGIAAYAGSDLQL